MGSAARTVSTGETTTPPWSLSGGRAPRLGGQNDPRDGDPRDDETPGDGEGDVGVKTRTKPKTKRPSLYKVLMLNDDYTPMEFVVYVLQRFFAMDHTRAVDVMLTVHNKGVAVVGVYPYEVAETKVMQVMDCARSNQHPLQCTLEKE